MKKLLLILLCLPMIGFGQLTSVPDNVFEEWIETNMPEADNGIVNDNLVLTAGLDATLPSNGAMALLGLVISGAALSNPIINDFTGIEDFINLPAIEINGLNSTIIDLSQVELSNNHPTAYLEYIHIKNCPLVTDIILPPDSFSLTLAANTYLTNIVFQPSTYFQITGLSYYALQITGCNSLTSIDISNISGVQNSSILLISSNTSLTQLNLKNGFCYNWGTVQFGGSPNLFCIQVDDPNYSSISANWLWSDFMVDPLQYGYSTNCGWPSAVEEHITNKELLKVTDILGRETKPKANTPFIEIYDDGTVEKRIVIE